MTDIGDDGVPPNRFAPEPIVSDIGAIPDREYAPFNFSAEDDKLIFEFSAGEFAKVLSALRNGAYMTYGDEGSSVYWSFLRNVDYPVLICEAVLACFVGDEDFRHAVIDALTSDSYFTEKMQTLIDNGSIITTPGEIIVQNDDLDALFGSITYLVDTMNGANIDLYEAMEASSNKRELGQILFEAIPIIETLPVDEISEYGDELLEAVAENYTAQYTTTPITGMRDRLRCGLFCLARDNENSLSWELIANWFWGEVGFTAGDYIDTFVDFVNFFLSGSWVGDEVVLISFANIASVLSTTQKFAEMTFPSLKGILALGANDPDPDWETLCEDCPEPGEWITIDFTVSDQGWLPVGTYAAYSSGVGWGVGAAANNQIAIKSPSNLGDISEIQTYLTAPLDSYGTQSTHIGNYLFNSFPIVGSAPILEFNAYTGTAVPNGLSVNYDTSSAWANGAKIWKIRYKLA